MTAHVSPVDSTTGPLVILSAPDLCSPDRCSDECLWSLAGVWSFEGRSLCAATGSAHATARNNPNHLLLINLFSIFRVASSGNSRNFHSSQHKENAGKRPFTIAHRGSQKPRRSPGTIDAPAPSSRGSLHHSLLFR